MADSGMIFCTSCGKETAYILKKRSIKRAVQDKDHPFTITVAVCSECGKEVDISGFVRGSGQTIDNRKKLSEQVISIDEIGKLMDIYNIGKAPLSMALGFGEVTIARYFEGQLPSKEYSDILKTALASPSFIKQKLEENKDKLTDAAYRKALTAADSMKEKFSVSGKMLMVISHLFKTSEEIAPLALHKLLYFIQGIFTALHGEPMFEEDCTVGPHGPVYKEVYDLFSDFRYNPADDPRFAIFELQKDDLTDEEKGVIDLVVNSFGMYSGKTLEKLIFSEEPWVMFAENAGNDTCADTLMPKEDIAEYFISVKEYYDLCTEEGIKEYIRDVLQAKCVCLS